MQEVRIWSSAVDQPTLQSWMNRGVDPPRIRAYANLSAYWPLGSASQAVILDESGHGKRCKQAASTPHWLPLQFDGGVEKVWPLVATYHFRVVGLK